MSEQFGEEWKNEVMKLRKEDIVEHLKRACISRDRYNEALERIANEGKDV